MAETESEGTKEIETPKWFDFRKFRSLLTSYFKEIDLQVVTVFNPEEPFSSEFTDVDTLEGNALLDSTHRYAFTIGGKRDIGTANVEAFAQVKGRIYEIIFECINTTALPSDIEEFKDEASTLTRKLQNYFTGDLIFNFVSTYANNIMQIANLLGLGDNYHSLFDSVIVNPIEYLNKHRDRHLSRTEVQEQFKTPSWFDIDTFVKDVAEFMLDINLQYSKDGNTFIQVITLINEMPKILSDKKLSSTYIYRFTFDEETQQCRWNSPEFTPIKYRILEIIVQNTDFAKLPESFEDFWDQAKIITKIIGQRTYGDLLSNIYVNYLSLVQSLLEGPRQEIPGIPYKELLRHPNPRRTIKQFESLK